MVTADLPHTPILIQTHIIIISSHKNEFQDQIFYWVAPDNLTQYGERDKFHYCVLSDLSLRCVKNAIMLQPHVIICQVVAYNRLKTKENFKLSALNVVAGSSYSDLTWKLLVF